MTSRAAIEVSSPTPIFQSKPSGRITGSIAVAHLGDYAVLHLGRLAVMHGEVGRRPEQQRDQHDHRAGAIEEGLAAIDQPQCLAMRRFGQRYGGISRMNGASLLLRMVDFSSRAVSTAIRKPST